MSGVQIVAYDYSKTFDTLSPDLIVRRLQEAGLLLKFIHWIQSYLTNRFQAVRIGATVSTKEPVTSGVPQGSVLGHLLFCLIVSDLKPINADTTTLVKYVDDMCSNLQKQLYNHHVIEEHENILRWSSNNGFKVNLDKCKSVTFTKTHDVCPIQLNGVSSVSKFKFLELWINEKLTRRSHVEEVCRLASQRIYGFRVLKNLWLACFKESMALKQVLCPDDDHCVARKASAKIKFSFF